MAYELVAHGHQGPFVLVLDSSCAASVPKRLKTDTDTVIVRFLKQVPKGMAYMVTVETYLRDYARLRRA